MKYRQFGNLDWKISELSVGVLSLEEAVADPGERNEDERVAAVRYAVDEGVNYINLGYPAHFENPSAACAYVTAALADGYREKVKLAVNISTRDAGTQEDLEKALNAQLGLFQLKYADFCILDWVDRSSWMKLKELGISSWAMRTVSSGKARHIGFTFHDDAYYLKDINDTYPDWAVLQMELSMLDYKHHPGVGGFKFTQEYCNAVIATDVTKGGRLLKNIPASVQAIWDRAVPQRPIDEWCLRWTLGFSELSSVLVNFRSVEQVKEYLAYAAGADANSADVMEMLQASRIRDAYYAARDVQCTACRCCMPCALGIDAPRIVELCNDAVIFGDDKIPRFIYNLEKHSLLYCSQCNRCAQQCPKHFPLPAVMADARHRFYEN